MVYLGRKRKWNAVAQVRGHSSLKMTHIVENKLPLKGFVVDGYDGFYVCKEELIDAGISDYELLCYKRSYLAFTSSQFTLIATRKDLEKN